MTTYYILEGHKAVPANEKLWAFWFEKAHRSVAHTDIGQIKVITVFMDLEHGFSQGDPPLLFETMVFGGPLDGELQRYATWEEAEIGHAAMVKRCRAARSIRVPPSHRRRASGGKDHPRPTAAQLPKHR